MKRKILNAKERKIADTLSGSAKVRACQSLLFWSAKLASLVDGNDARGALLYMALRDCILYDAMARALGVTGLWPFSKGFESRRWDFEHFMAKSTLSAHLAVSIVASIKGVSIDTHTLVPRGDWNPESVLRAAYSLLAVDRGVSSPQAEQKVPA